MPEIYGACAAAEEVVERFYNGPPADKATLLQALNHVRSMKAGNLAARLKLRQVYPEIRRIATMPPPDRASSGFAAFDRKDAPTEHRDAWAATTVEAILRVVQAGNVPDELKGPMAKAMVASAGQATVARS